MAHILVNGGGIAGLSLTLLLRRSGHEVTVVERAPGWRSGGQAVDLRGAGRTVVDRLGLLPAARAAALHQRGIAWVDTRGRHRGRMPVDAFGGEGIVSEIEILRDDLVEILLGALDDGVELLSADSVTALRQDETGVDVTLASGGSRRVDLLVGADGVGSGVRTLTFGPRTGWRPLGCVMAWFTAPDPGDLDGWYLMHNAPGGRVVSLRPGRTHDSAKAGLGLRVHPDAALPHHIGDQRDLLAATFADVGWHTPMLLTAMQHADDFAFTPVAQVHLSRWSSGRVVLLGDAASCPSPLTGLGTSTALVQAWVLAWQLAGLGSEHPRAALDRYEEACRPFVRQAQELPPGGVGGYAPSSAFSIGLRRYTMATMRHWPLRPILERQFAKAGAVALPGAEPSADPRPHHGPAARARRGPYV